MAKSLNVMYYILVLSLLSQTVHADLPSASKTIANVKRAECQNSVNANYFKLHRGAQVIISKMPGLNFLINSRDRFSSSYPINFYPHMFNTTYSGLGGTVIDRDTKEEGSIFLMADTNRILLNNNEPLLVLYTNSAGKAREETMNCFISFFTFD